MRRKSLMGSIMASLAMLNPFASPAVKFNNPPERFTKPPTKAKFKQNQRKERKASARKKVRK